MSNKLISTSNFKGHYIEMPFGDYKKAQKLLKQGVSIDFRGMDYARAIASLFFLSDIGVDESKINMIGTLNDCTCLRDITKDIPYKACYKGIEFTVYQVEGIPKL